MSLDNTIMEFDKSRRFGSFVTIMQKHQETHCT